jgi:hypothetical protein
MALEHIVDDRPGHAAHPRLRATDHPGREAALDESAQPAVPRVVHVEDGGPVPEHLRWRVEDANSSGGAEQLGMPADMEDVVVPGERPVAGPPREAREVRAALRHEMGRRLAAEGREGGLAHLSGGGPEPFRPTGRCPRCAWVPAEPSPAPPLGNQFAGCCRSPGRRASSSLTSSPLDPSRHTRAVQFDRCPGHLPPATRPGAVE